MDKFIQTCVIEQNPFVSNSKYISVAAAVSAIVASKIHESSRSLSAASFPFFKSIDLVSFERYLLDKIQYDISPNESPTIFMLKMLEAWEEGSQLHEALLREASALLSVFWLSIESIEYAPFTIATGALLLAFSKLQINPSRWLQTLPEDCIPRSSPLCFDVDCCLKSFVKSGSISSSSLQISVPSLDESKIRSQTSPSTIVNAPMSPTVVPTLANFANASSRFVPIKSVQEDQEQHRRSFDAST